MTTSTMSDTDQARGYRVLLPSDLGDAQDDEREFAFDVLQGLTETPRRLPSRYFYDDEGSRLFQSIMDAEDYYPTDCEHEILSSHGREIAERVAKGPIDVVELGAGDGSKTLHLLRHLTALGADVVYRPIDISEGAMRALVAAVSAEVPGLRIEGIVADNVTGLHWLGDQDDGRKRLILFLGSNIGNFNGSQARAFLRRVWSAMHPGDLALIGFDLKKDIDVLLRAYNDSDGVTARFNLNLLERINRQLGGEFDASKFRHFNTYDVLSGAMKSYLVSQERQTVYIDALRHRFEFAPWEAIHTEYSYKFLPTDIAGLAEDTGFTVDHEYRDRRSYFVDSLWCIEPGPVVRP